MSFLVERTGPNSVNYFKSDDVVVFCQKRFIPGEIKNVIPESNGLKDQKKVEEFLVNSDYIPVLTAIWCEEDSQAKLNWLREKATLLHAPLLFELGLAEFRANPTEESFHKVVIPLFKSARLRVEQDIACVEDISLSDAGALLEMIYAEALNQLIKEHLKMDLTVLNAKERTLRVTATKAKIGEIALLTRTSPMPNPQWIGNHGMKAWFGPVKLHDESLWPALRDKVYQDVLK